MAKKPKNRDKRALEMAKRAYERAHLPSFDDARPKESDKRAYARWLRELRSARDQARRLDPIELLLMMADQCPTLVCYFEHPSRVEGASPDHWFHRGDNLKVLGVAERLRLNAYGAKGDLRGNRSVLTSITVDVSAKAK